MGIQALDWSGLATNAEEHNVCGGGGQMGMRMSGADQPGTLHQNGAMSRSCSDTHSFKQDQNDIWAHYNARYVALHCRPMRLSQMTESVTGDDEISRELESTVADQSDIYIYIPTIEPATQSTHINQQRAQSCVERTTTHTYVDHEQSHLLRAHQYSRVRRDLFPSRLEDQG